MTPRIDPNKELSDLLDNPSCPFWIQNLVPILLEKDPVDVTNAVQHLAEVLEKRLNALLACAQEWA